MTMRRVFQIMAVLGVFLGLFLSFWLGVAFGDINAEIDFCLDDGSTRFIEDEAARDWSCSSRDERVRLKMAPGGAPSSGMQ